MKLAFLQSGCFEDVDMIAEQVRVRQVKDTDTEKPVTKQMLSEIYKWTES